MINCKDILVLVIYVYLMLYVLKDDKQKIFATFVAAWLLKDTFMRLTVSIDGLAVNNNAVKSGGAEEGPEITPTTVNTGPYDGLCLKTGNREYWMKSPDETSLISNDKLYTYLSSQGPIKMRLSDQAALKGPPVDGVTGSPEKMFMMANNVTSPLCCPSTFSTSTGCLCTTKNQRDFIAARGTMDDDSKYDIPKDEIEA